MNTPRRSFLKSTFTAPLAMTTMLEMNAAGSARNADKIRVGQIGTGHAHASKLEVFRRSTDYEVIGVVEPNPELKALAERQETYRGLTWMSQDQLLSTPGLQLVLVETEVRDLLNAAEAAVDAGKHVHLDKPAGESLEHYRKILRVAEQKKLLIQMGYMYRYNPGVVLLHEILAEGWLGEIFEVHTVMSKVVDPAARKKLAEYPGGIFFELGCHVTDLVIGVLGAPKTVVAFPIRTVREHDQLVDNMLAVLTYEHATATIKSSAVEIEGGSRRHLIVCGTHGSLQIQPLDDPMVTLTLDRPRGKYRKGTQQIQLPKYTRYVDDAADIARIIRGDSAPRYSYSHDLIVQETVLRGAGVLKS